MKKNPIANIENQTKAVNNIFDGDEELKQLISELTAIKADLLLVEHAHRAIKKILNNNPFDVN